MSLGGGSLSNSRKNGRIYKKKENVTIKLNCSIKEIHDKHVITDKDTKFKFKHLISTIPSSKLRNFDFLKIN